MKHIWCMYYLSEGHALNLLDVIHPKRGDLMVNERTVSQKHQNYIISRWICRVNNILFSDAFWISKANELVSHFFSIFRMFHVKIRQKRNKKRRISLNHAGTLWILSIMTGFLSPGAISFHISLYVRNCSKHGTVFRSVFMFSSLCILPISCNF